MLAHMTSAFRIPMTGRSTDERHRVSSPLELLFDLTFVVAIAQVAAQLAHAIDDGHARRAVVPVPAWCSSPSGGRG